MVVVVGLTLWVGRTAYAVLGSIAIGAGCKQLLTITFDVSGWWRRLGVAFIGVLGIATCFALDHLVGKEVLWIGVVSGALAMLWMSLFAPLLFARLGWGRTEVHPAAASAEVSLAAHSAPCSSDLELVSHAI